MINSNWHSISSYRFGVIAAYCSNFRHFAFSESPIKGIWTTYDVHLGLIGKRVLVLIELFSVGVTAEALLTNIGSNPAVSLLRTGWPKTSRSCRVAPTKHSCQKTRLHYFPYSKKIQGTSLFRLVAMHAFDRQRDRQAELSSQDRFVIPCSAVKVKLSTSTRQLRVNGQKTKATVAVTSDMKTGRNEWPDITCDSYRHSPRWITINN